MTDHRLLTVRQPWAQPIVDGLKSPENRGPTFGTSFRGPLWIHAGRTWDDDGLRSPLVSAAYLEGTLFTNYREAGFTLGAVIGRVIVVDAHHAEPGCCNGSPWAVRDDGTTHLVFGPDRMKVRGPVVAGALGLWRADRIPGLAATLDDLVAEHATTTHDEEFGVDVSTDPAKCSHPSGDAGRCVTCWEPMEVAPC